jgi:hypothetical protein
VRDPDALQQCLLGCRAAWSAPASAEVGERLPGGSGLGSGEVVSRAGCPRGQGAGAVPDRGPRSSASGASRWHRASRTRRRTARTGGSVRAHILASAARSSRGTRGPGWPTGPRPLTENIKGPFRIAPKRPLIYDSFESGRQDLNLRPLDPQSSALPSCATSRCAVRGEPRDRAVRTLPYVGGCAAVGEGGGQSGHEWDIGWWDGAGAGPGRGGAGAECAASGRAGEAAAVRSAGGGAAA